MLKGETELVMCMRNQNQSTCTININGPVSEKSCPVGTWVKYWLLGSTYFSDSIGRTLHKVEIFFFVFSSIFDDNSVTDISIYEANFITCEF